MAGKGRKSLLPTWTGLVATATKRAFATFLLPFYPVTRSRSRVSRDSTLYYNYTDHDHGTGKKKGKRLSGSRHAEVTMLRAVCFLQKKTGLQPAADRYAACSLFCHVGKAFFQRNTLRLGSEHPDEDASLLSHFLGTLRPGACIWSGASASMN